MVRLFYVGRLMNLLQKHDAVRLVRSNHQIRVFVIVQIDTPRESKAECRQCRRDLLSRDGLGVFLEDAQLTAVVDVDDTPTIFSTVWCAHCNV